MEDRRPIFISFRRHDALGYARWLYELIGSALGADAMFVDFDYEIRPGDYSRDEINHRIGTCDVMLALIGPDWLTSPDEAGYQYLDKPFDLIRLEIAEALDQQKLVIPVLVNGADVPREEDLPNELKELSRKTPIRLGNESFENDARKLASDLQAIIERRAFSHDPEDYDLDESDWGIDADAGVPPTEDARFRVGVSGQPPPELGRVENWSLKSSEVPSKPQVLLAASDVDAAKGAIFRPASDDLLAKVESPARTLLRIALFAAGATALAYAFGRDILDWVAGGAVAAGSNRSPEDDATFDRVRTSVFAPRAAEPGQTIMVQVYLHLYEVREEVGADAKEIDAEAERRIGAALTARVKQGSTICAQLAPPQGRAADFKIESPQPYLVWDGAPGAIQFFVDVGDDALPAECFFDLRIFEEARPLGAFRFKLDITDVTSRETEIDADYHVYEPAASATAYERLFLSYARDDFDSVKLIARSFDMVDQDFFLDLKDMRSGVYWRRELQENISRSDGFVLFWSMAAKNSAMVRQEVNWALASESATGKPHFMPLPIEGPPPPPMWDDVKERNFSDPHYYTFAKRPE